MKIPPRQSITPLFFGNSATNGNTIYSDVSTLEIKYSLLEGTAWKSTHWGSNSSGNIITTTDPFIDAENGNYKLKPCSEPIDAGDSTLYGSTLSSENDLNGRPRLYGNNIDMGAYEFQPSDFVNLGMDTTVCIGSSLTLDAQNIGTTYEWSDGSTDQTLIVTSAGTYSVIVTDDNGCVGEDTIIDTEGALPIVELGADESYCQDKVFTRTLDAQNIGATYEWNDGSTDQTLIVTNAGTYSVSVTDDNGCVGSDTVNITEEDCASLEDWSQNQLSVFPNPSTTGIFKVIAAQTFSGESIIVLNALGQEIATYTFTGTEVVVDLSKEESGLYLLKTNTQTFKLIK